MDSLCPCCRAELAADSHCPACYFEHVNIWSAYGPGGWHCTTHDLYREYEP